MIVFAPIQSGSAQGVSLDNRKTMDVYLVAKQILYLAIAVIIYFIPNWIAIARKHHNGTVIFVINLLFGWTVIGWIAAFIWSLTAVKQEASENTEKRSGSKQCPYCAETIKKEAKVCRYCGREL